MSDESKLTDDHGGFVALYGAPMPPSDWKPRIFGAMVPPPRPDPEALMRAIIATFAECDECDPTDFYVAVWLTDEGWGASLSERAGDEELVPRAPNVAPTATTMHEALSKLAGLVVEHFEPRTKALATLRGMLP